MTDRLIRLTTALGVVAVASVAAVIPYELVASHGETGLTAPTSAVPSRQPDLGRPACTDRVCNAGWTAIVEKY
jgi:hypothetical protein